MSFTDNRPLRERLMAAAPTLLVQGAVGYVLLTGLAVTLTAPPVDTLETRNIPVEVPPPPDDPVPPRPMPRAERVMELPRPDRSTTILTEPTQPAADADGGPVVVDPGPTIVTVAPPPPPPAANLSRGAAPRGSQGDWFPQDSYPAAARRAGAEGRVSLAVDVGVNGRVTACRVTASSGNPDLDAATCRLATRHGRFTPALGADGTPIAATYPLRNVRWVLEQ